MDREALDDLGSFLLSLVRLTSLDLSNRSHVMLVCFQAIYTLDSDLLPQLRVLEKSSTAAGDYLRQTSQSVGLLLLSVSETEDPE